MSTLRLLTISRFRPALCCSQRPRSIQRSLHAGRGHRPSQTFPQLALETGDAEGAAIRRRRKYVNNLNNIVEQDHRGVKRITRPMLGFKAFDAAQSTLVCIELMHMIKKRQLMVEEGNEGLTAAEQFYALAA